MTVLQTDATAGDLGPAAHERLRQLAYQERLRVAREVHDLVGHGLTVIDMQAGIALHVAQKRPDQAEVALAAIKTTCETVLAELRGTLAVFRQRDTDAPAAGLDWLGDLVEEVRTSGVTVELDVSGQRPALAAAADLAAYRIAQESLTNVLRHAGPAAAATVRVRYSPLVVALEVLDDGGAHPGGRTSRGRGGSSGGHGITGMRERAAALGGTLVAGPRDGGGFRVHARLPASATTSHTAAPAMPS